MITEIIFSNKDKTSIGIQNVTDWSVGMIAKEIINQESIGRDTYHIRTGYPVYCSHCKAPVTLSPIEHSHLICDKCQKSPVSQLFKEQLLIWRMK